jgi:serine/threonine protein phosphatase PrpC
MNAAATALTGSRMEAGKVRLDVAGATDVGRERPRNEDAYLIATLQRSIVVHDASPEAARGWLAGESAGTLMIVADGMGAQGGGHIASQVAVSTIAGYLLNIMPWTNLRGQGPAGRETSASLTGVRDQLSSAILAGDATVKQTGAQTASPQMGTTLTLAFVRWPMLYVTHVGDSRCYLFRSGMLTRLTTDHTVAQKLNDDGIAPLDPESLLNNVLWNSLGANQAAPQPQIWKQNLALGDILLLCSDGLTKHVSDQEIGAVLGSGEASAVQCGRLIQLANERGGSDNITAVIANGRI